MAVELAVAYVSIVPETSKIAPGVRQALTGAEKGAEKSGQSMGSRISAGMGGVLKKSAIGVGVAAGAAVGAGLTKGLGRLNGIEQAESKLTGLGHSAKSVGSIMDNALAAVKGTSFGLEQAATVAASAVAAGVQPGQDLERTLRLVGDAASIAGTDMSSMGAIFNKVAASNKMQMDVVNQLHDQGVPILQLVAQEMGVTAEEAQKMASAGQVSFDIFQSAMESGLGGAALAAGDTVQGAFANMGAAAGRLGATIAGPFFRQSAGGFRGVTDALDAMNGRMGPVMADVEAWLVGTAVPAFQKFTTEGKKAWDAFSGADQARAALASTISALESMGALVAGLAPAVFDLAGAFAKASAALGISTWDVLVTVLDAAATILNATMVPALEAVASLAENNQGAVTAMVAAWMAFKTVPGIVSKVQPPLQNMARTMDVGTMSVRAMGQDFRRLAPQIGVTGAAMKSMGTHSSTIRNMQNAFIGAGTSTRGFTQAIRVGAAPAMTRLQTGAKNLIGAMGGPWGLAFAAATVAVSSAISGLRKMDTVVEEMRRESEIATEAFTTMFDAIMDGGNRLDVAEQAVGNLTQSMQTMADNGPNWFHRGLLAIEDHTIAVAGLESEYYNAGTAVRQASDDAKAAGDVMSELELTERDLAAAAMGTEAAYKQQRAALMENGRGGEYLAGQLDKLRESFTSAEAAAERLGPAGMTAADALQDVAEKAGTAEDRASKLRIAFMELAGIELSATEASAELTRVLERTAGQMDEVAGATVGVNGAFDTTTSAGAAAHDALMGIGDAMQRSVASGNDVNQVFSQSEADLRAVADAAGLTEDQYQALLEAYGLTPEQLVTVAEVQADAALASMTQLQSAFKDFSGEPMTKTLQVQDEDARAKLEAMGFELSNLDEHGNVDITVEDQAAIDKLDRFMLEEMPKVDGQTAEAHAFLEADGLFATNNLAIAQLYTLDLKRPTPLANMDVSRLSTAQIDALNKVGLLDGQTPTPDADLNIDQLTAEQQAALAKVFNLDSQTPTPWADMTKDQLDAKGDEALRKLGEIDDSKPNPLVNARTQSAMDKLGGVRDLLASLKDKNIFVNIFRRNHGDGNAAGGRFARGGRYRFPAYADGDRHDGYRLPTSGPGTNQVDGFLAFDQDGMPAARLDAGEWIINGRSSEKYNKELKAINAGTFPKLPGYNTGGRAGEKPQDDVDPDGVFSDVTGGTDMPTADDFLRLARGESTNGFQMERALQGAPYENYPGRNGAWGDCSYTAGAFAAFALGLDPANGRRFSTVSQMQWARANGMNIGIGPAGTFRMGWYDNGGGQFGHTSSTLPDGTNAEMGGGNGGGALGGGAVPFNHPQFTHHAWAPVGSAASPSTGDGAALPGTGVDADEVELTGDAAKAAETVTEAQNDPNSVFYGTGANSWSDLAGNIAKSFVGGQVSAILSVFDIPDTLPPLIKAGQKWKMQREEGKTQQEQEKELVESAQAVEDADTAAAEVEASVDVGDWGEPYFVREISRAAKDRGLDREAAVIATGTAHVESGNPMLMYANRSVPESLNYRHDAIGSDHDSVGLFQQRNNGAWGTTAERMDPFKSAGMFFRELASFDWRSMSRGEAAQRVQRSAFPSRYEPAMPGAESLVDQYGVFDSGGHARGKGLMPKDIIEPERVLSPEQTRAFDELVYNQLPRLSSLTGPAAKGVINAGAGAAGAAANAVVPGAGAAVGAVAAPVAEMAGWYVGQVTDGLQTSVEDFGRDMSQIPRSMVDSLAGEFMPGGMDRIGSLVPSLPPLAAPAPEPVSTGDQGGQTVNNFNGYDQDWAWSKFRRLESERLGGKVGARG